MGRTEPDPPAVGASPIPGLHPEFHRWVTGLNVVAVARRQYVRMPSPLNLMENGGKDTRRVKATCGLMGRPLNAPKAPSHGRHHSAPT